MDFSTVQCNDYNSEQTLQLNGNVSLNGNLRLHSHSSWLHESLWPISFHRKTRTNLYDPLLYHVYTYTIHCAIPDPSHLPLGTTRLKEWEKNFIAPTTLVDNRLRWYSPHSVDAVRCIESQREVPSFRDICPTPSHHPQPSGAPNQPAHNNLQPTRFDDFTPLRALLVTSARCRCVPTRNLELTFIIHVDTVPVLVRFVDVPFKFTLVMGSWFIQRVWLDEVSRTVNEQKKCSCCAFLSQIFQMGQFAESKISAFRISIGYVIN